MSTKLRRHSFQLDELAIDTGNIELLMGYEPGEALEPFPALIEEVFGELKEHCHPQGGYVIVERPEFDMHLNLTRIGRCTFHTGRIVTRMLRKSECIAVFICTAGAGIETWTKQVNEAGDPVRAFVIDAFGSEITDAVAGKLQACISENMKRADQSMTNRYYPGYCDWPVSDQQTLFSFFPQQFCGVTLSGSSLMYPVKSASGVIGIGTGVHFQAYTCDSCKDENCMYRKIKFRKTA